MTEQEEMKAWAKKMCLELLDCWFEDPDIVVDEEHLQEFKVQRDRIAELLAT